MSLNEEGDRAIPSEKRNYSLERDEETMFRLVKLLKATESVVENSKFDNSDFDTVIEGFVAELNTAIDNLSYEADDKAIKIRDGLGDNELPTG